jgi:hypothetical protein
VSFNGTSNINLPGVNQTGNQNTTGSAASLTTARDFAVGNTTRSFNGTANVSWSLVDIGAAARTLTLTAGTGLTGGGDLTDNRTFNIDVATQAEAAAGTDNTKVMTPLRAKQTSESFSKAVGEVFAIWDHLSGANAPSNAGSAKFIRLTAGQSGAGGYNQGLLTNESVSGSAPLVTATAQIATGPLQGQTVPLLNTEGSFIRPGTSSGGLQFDQMQRITGNLDLGDSQRGAFRGSAGAFTRSLGASGGSTSSNAPGNRRADFDSGNSPNARVSADTGGETRPKNRQATYYMRIV